MTYSMSEVFQRNRTCQNDRKTPYIWHISVDMYHFYHFYRNLVAWMSKAIQTFVFQLCFKSWNPIGSLYWNTKWTGIDLWYEIALWNRWRVSPLSIQLPDVSFHRLHSLPRWCRGDKPSCSRSGPPNSQGSLCGNKMTGKVNIKVWKEPPPEVVSSLTGWVNCTVRTQLLHQEHGL